MAKIKDPQELEVHFIIPAIIRDLALALKKKGFDQKRIAALLSLTEPAVSQYMHQKRAIELRFSDEIQAEIQKAATRLEQGSSLLQETQRILKIIMNDKVTCRMCNEHLH